MNLLSLVAEILIEHRREQRVRETDRPAVALEDMRRQGTVERVSLNARPLEHGIGTRPQRGDKCERPARRCRQTGDPRLQQLVESVRDGKRLGRVEL